MNITLDQWKVLEAVVQLGSFAAAATKMNRSQSTISSAISRLQEQLGIPLLEVKGRKAHLTETGKALLADVEPLLTGFRALEQRASSLAAGGATQVCLAVDSLYPDERLFSALAELSRLHPHVHPQLRKAPFISSPHEFASSGADLCITGLPGSEYSMKPILDIRMRAVARAGHPLHAGSRQLTRLDLIQHLAAIIEGTRGPEPKRQPHAPSQRFLTVNTIYAAIEAVRSGLCFGWLPVYRISEYLSSGELMPLRLPLGAERIIRLLLVCKDLDSTSPEKTCLASLLGSDREVELL
jgi:DNA-binding transcriptional LysR family regulator